MIPVTIDNLPFEVYGNRTLWSPPSAAGAFINAPAEWAELARALACCDYDSCDGHLYLLDRPLYLPAEPGSLVSFPLKADIPPLRAKRVQTGTYAGQRIIVVLEWDDPLDQVITTREAEALFGLALNSANRAAQRGGIPARKSGKVWLLRRIEAERQWG